MQYFLGNQELEATGVALTSAPWEGRGGPEERRLQGIEAGGESHRGSSPAQLTPGERTGEAGPAVSNRSWGCCGQSGFDRQSNRRRMVCKRMLKWKCLRYLPSPPRRGSVPKARALSPQGQALFLTSD